MNLNTTAEKVHNNAVQHGWWDKPPSLPESLMLCVGELSEAMEEYRNHHLANEIYYKDGKLEGVPIELADTIIRILDICAYYEIDIDSAVKDKMEYNKSRSFRHGGKRL